MRCRRSRPRRRAADVRMLSPLPPPPTRRRADTDKRPPKTGAHNATTAVVVAEGKSAKTRALCPTIDALHTHGYSRDVWPGVANAKRRTKRRGYAQPRCTSIRTRAWAIRRVPSPAAPGDESLPSSQCRGFSVITPTWCTLV